MAHLLSNIKDYFELEDINIDNWVFKLFYKVSCGLCMTGATIGVASQYFGDPISCEFAKGISDQVGKDYCWIHGSSYIPEAYQNHLKCIVAQEYLTKTNAPDTSFYQWVTFMMALQAALFYLPHKIWESVEGGLIESFGAEGKKLVMLSETSGYDDGVMLEDIVHKYVKYFKSIFHHNSWYFIYFVSCEFLNYLLLAVQIHVTDLFLNHKFAWYGWETVVYYSYPAKDRNVELGLSNPMCAIFPTEVSCTIPSVGTAGKEEFNNGLCILTQNIINEKIYLVLWFWYAFLVPVSVLFLLYRLITIFCGTLRFNLIYKTICHKYDKNIRKCLHFVLSKGQIGDWFVLYQLCKNCNPYFFRNFVMELALEINTRPKKSKNPGSPTDKGPLDSPGNPRPIKTAFTPSAMKKPGTAVQSQESASAPSFGTRLRNAFESCFTFCISKHQMEPQIRNTSVRTQMVRDSVMPVDHRDIALSFDDTDIDEDELGEDWEEGTLQDVEYRGSEKPPAIPERLTRDVATV